MNIRKNKKNILIVILLLILIGEIYYYYYYVRNPHISYTDHFKLNKKYKIRFTNTDSKHAYISLNTSCPNNLPHIL